MSVIIERVKPHRYRVKFDKPINGVNEIYTSDNAIVAWQTLLGLQTVSDVIKAMLTATEPDTVDKERPGVNAWTSAYDALGAALNDYQPAMFFASVDNAQPTGVDPLTQGINQTRALLGLPLKHAQPTPALFYAVENSEDHESMTPAESDELAVEGVDDDGINRFFNETKQANELETALTHFYQPLQPDGGNSER